MYGYNSYNYMNANTHADVWTIVSLLVAICGGIVIYFTFLNKNNAKNYTGTTKKLYDFLSFQKLSLEAILKVCYLVIALFITIMSFSLISTSFVAFIMMLVIGNIITRFLFEGALLIIMMYHKLVEISDKMPSKTSKKESKEEK